MDAHGYSRWGLDFMQGGNFLEATKAFSKAIAIDASDPMVFYLRGVCRSVLNHYKESIEDFDKAIALDSKLHFAYYQRSLSKVDVNDNQGALEDVQEAIRLCDRNAVYHHQAGEVKLLLKDLLGAFLEFSAAVDIDQWFHQARFCRAQIAKEFNHYGLCLHDLTTIIDSLKETEKQINHPNKAEVLLLRATLQLEAEKYQAAIQDYSLALKIFPHHGDAFYYRGKAKTALGQNTEAKKDFETYQSINN